MSMAAKTKIPYWLVLALVVSILLMLSPPAEGAKDNENEPTLTVKAGFSGYVRIGEPVLFRVEIENPGPEINGAIKISTNQNGSRVVFSRPVVLPSGSKKSVNLYVSDDQANTFNLRLISSDGQEIATSRVKVNRLAAQELIVGVLSGNSSALNYLGGMKLYGNAQRAMVIHLDAADVPTEAAMLTSIDLLVLSDFSSRSLTPEQLSAMESWVEGGGMMVTGGGAGWQKTLDGLPATLLPVQVSGSVQVNRLPELEKLGKHSLPVGNIVVSRGQLNEGGNILAAHDSLPLVVESSLGKGNLYYMAFDPGAEPFANWSGNENLWLNLLTRSDPHQIISASNARIMMMDQKYNMRWVLQTIPASDLPSRGGLAAVLLLYIIILGPVVYLLLKKFDRRELGWVVIPVMAILLFATTYFLGFKGSGRDIFTRIISVVEMEPGVSHARVTSYIGAFAPTHREYTLNLNGNRLVNTLPIDSYRQPVMADNDDLPVMAEVEQGENTTVKFGDSSRWSTRSIQTLTSFEPPGGIEADLHAQGSQVKGTLTNHTGQELENCVIYGRYGYQKLNRLKAGETVPVNLSLYLVGQNRSIYSRLFDSYPIHYPSGFNPYTAEQQSKMRIMEMFFNSAPSNQIMFVGWSQQEIEGVMEHQAERGKVYPTTAWVSPLPVELSYEGALSIPPGIITGRIIEVKANYCEQNMQSVHFEGGPVTFEMDLPVNPKDIKIKKLSLLAPSNDFNSARSITMELYNWARADWDEVKYQLMGNPLEDWQHYLSDEGSMRVRIGPSQANSYVNLQGVTLSLEADSLIDGQTGGRGGN